MLENEFKLMLKSIASNKKAFKKLYKTGFFSYSKNGAFIGEASIINDKAIVAFLQDTNDENNVIATANFQDGANIIYKLSGDNYSLQQFGKSIMNMDGNGFYTSHRYNPDKAGILRDISSIRTHCAETREKASSKSSLISFFKKSLSSEKLSKHDVLVLLEQTISNLAYRKSQNTGKRNVDTISPKINTSPVQHISSTRSVSNNDVIR